MVDVVEGQNALLIVHCKIVVPEPIPVNPDVAKFGFVILAVPVSNVHTPVPIVGIFAFNDVVLVQMF